MNAKNGLQSDLRECYCYFGDFSASKPSSTSQPLLFFCALLRFPSCWMPFEFKILTVLIFFKPRKKKKPKHLTVIADQSMSVNNYPDFFSLRRVWNLSDEKKSIHQKQIQRTVISSLTSSAGVWDGDGDGTYAKQLNVHCSTMRVIYLKKEKEAAEKGVTICFCTQVHLIVHSLVHIMIRFIVQSV